MTSLGRIIAQMIAVFGVVLAGFASAHGADGTTKWRGVYAYEDGRPPVHYTMTLTTKGKAISGRLEEDATFGDGTSDKLYADIAGKAFGFTVSFTKKYDGTGGQTHSVAYRGTIDGMTMFGVWQVSGGNGTWYATTVAR